MQELTIERCKEILKNAEGQEIAVIGDIMLDRFIWGNVSRISPEAPVPVLEFERETYHLGGAANVSSNIKSLGAKPILLGVLGDDRESEIFLDIMRQQGLTNDGIFIDPDKSTTVKTRLIAVNQHIARIDRENKQYIDKNIQEFFLNYLKSIKNLKAIVFEDYNKGLLPKEFIKRVIDFAREKNIFISVDPKQENFFEYKNVNLFKPNLKEAQYALGYPLNSLEERIRGGKDIIERLQCDNILLTLGADGMMLFGKNCQTLIIPTGARQVADVSGAGDTAIATFTIATIGGASIEESAMISNYAAGTVCEKPGVVAIEIEDLLRTIKRNSGL